MNKSSREDLNHLIRHLEPELNGGKYVFIKSEKPSAKLYDDCLGMFKESEGLTYIVSLDTAIALNINYELEMAWITLNVESSLAAVGLTAVVSNALAKQNISCNVIAAYHHDHLFTPFKDRELAMKILKGLRV